MKGYVSSRWENRHLAAEEARVLESLGVEITHRWWEYTGTPEDIAIQDIEGVRAAHIVVVLSFGQEISRGVYAEIGAALLAGRPVYLDGGAPTNWLPGESHVFLRHPLVRPYSDLLDILKGKHAKSWLSSQALADARNY